ncbi:unnamed protein product [Cyprideis torosa]|uniref:Uncharacterized protein n=1 Tax=Cyprideis torosa TaxID=163714 RepID=A0A7R8WBI2_9CRUS|nr:unnamed protein product [Cyprideis torosa]CAG0892326.1 unnamed protein product [Cyprideis torosa]
MSYCKQDGKDRVIFLTEEDASAPSSVTFESHPEEDEPEGIILPNGEINWNCPCLGGMATGPCGYEFRQAFSCFTKRSVRLWECWVKGRGLIVQVVFQTKCNKESEASPYFQDSSFKKED